MKHLQPSGTLKPFVKDYFIYTADENVTNEALYPSGYVSLAVNISDGSVATIINGNKIAMPKIEVLGQLTVPTRLMASKGTIILVVRFYPFASSLFFPNTVSDFTNDSVDLRDVLDDELDKFYDELMQASSIEQMVMVLEPYLIQLLSRTKNAVKKVNGIEQICRQICSEESFNIKNISCYFGLSDRYIQKLFYEMVGLTPGSFFSIQRFNRSLELVRSSKQSLTSIAHQCGYYDQAHFIKDFKKFAGSTPSEIRNFSTISR